MGRCWSENMGKLFTIILISATPLLVLSNSNHGAQGQGGRDRRNSQKPAIFIFGDSLSDPGNNNYIASLSRADWSPYGIDFAPSGYQPTGRFTNGRTLVDIIGNELGQTELPQPYLAPTTHGQVLLNGVNYASGAGGIMNSTGTNFVECLNLWTQINYFGNTRSELISMMGYKRTMQFLYKSLFVIAIGSNDYLDNYLLPNFAMQSRYSSRQWELLLTLFLHSYIDKLYRLGGRKFIVSGIGPLGCIPYQLSSGGSVNGKCISAINKLVLNYNIRLKNLIHHLNSNLTGASFIYLNVYATISELLTNPKRYGFINVNTACCGNGGKFKGAVSCLPGMSYCGDERQRYMFFDAYHPTEAVNRISAAKFLNGSTHYVFPINIRQLVAL